MKSFVNSSICLVLCLLLPACGPAPAGGNEHELKTSIEVVESKVKIQPNLNLYSGGEIPKNFRLANGGE